MPTSSAESTAMQSLPPSPTDGAEAGPPAEDRRRELLPALCAETKPDPIQFACNRCPAYLHSDAEETASLDAGFVHWGSFTRPEADEALVDITGCNPSGPTRGGGAVLLRSTPAGWRRLFATLELKFDTCIAVPTAGGVTLVCEDGATGAGGYGGSIRRCTFSPGGAHCEDLVSTGYTSTCVAGDRTYEVSKESWRLEEVDAGSKVLKISMSFGSSTAKADHDCTVPEARTHHVELEFSVDGKRLRPTPETVTHLQAIGRVTD